MNLSKSIFKNTIALFIARIVNLGGNVLLVFYLSRMLQAEGLGGYSTAMAFFSLAVLACNLGLTNFIPRELAKDLSQTNRYFVHTSILILISSSIVALFLVLVAPHLGYEHQTVVSIYLIALSLAPATMRWVTGAIFVYYQRSEFVTFPTLLWTTIKIVASLYLLYQGQGVTSIIAVFTVTTYCAFFTAMYFYVRHIERPRFEFDFGFFKGMLNDMKSFIALAIGGSLFSQAETVMLSLVGGEIEVGFYTAAFKLITLWDVIPASFMEVVFPVLSRAYYQSGDKSQAIQEKALKYLLALAFPIAVGSFAVAEHMITIFYGPGFEKSILVLRILSWHIVVAFIDHILWRILLAREEQNVAVFVQLVSGLVRVSLSFVLGSLFGAVGAAWALIGGFAVYTALHVYFVNRRGKPLPFLRLGARFALAALVMGAVSLALDTVLPFILLVPVATLVYLLLVVVLRAFSQEDWALFRRVLPWTPNRPRSAPEGAD